MTTKYYLLILFILNYYYFIHSFGHPKLSRILLQKVKIHPLPQTTGLKYEEVNAKPLINNFEKTLTISVSNQTNLTSPHAPGGSDKYSEDDDIYQENNSSKDESISSSGVPVDYSFNETLGRTDDPNTLISSPGCPPSEAISFLPSHPWHRHIWVHYGNPPRCYKTGLQGPCPDGMSLGALLTSIYGQCNCNCFSPFGASDGKSTENLVVSPFMDQQRRFCADKYSNFYAIHTDKKCHQLYTRGPCGENETFVVGPGKNEAKCKVTNCSFLGKKKIGECGNDDNECFITKTKNQVPVCNPCSYCPYVPSPTVPDVEETDDVYEQYDDKDSITWDLQITEPICGIQFEYNELLQKCMRLQKPKRKGSVG